MTIFLLRIKVWLNEEIISNTSYIYIYTRKNTLQTFMLPCIIITKSKTKTSNNASEIFNNTIHIIILTFVIVTLLSNKMKLKNV